MKEVKEKYYDKMKETNQLYLFEMYTSGKHSEKQISYGIFIDCGVVKQSDNKMTM